jgi:hypothetical protein
LRREKSKRKRARSSSSPLLDKRTKISNNKKERDAIGFDFFFFSFIERFVVARSLSLEKNKKKKTKW